MAEEAPQKKLKKKVKKTKEVSAAELETTSAVSSSTSSRKILKRKRKEPVADISTDDQPVQPKKKKKKVKKFAAREPLYDDEDESESDDADILAEAKAELLAEGVDIPDNSEYRHVPEATKRDLALVEQLLQRKKDDDTMKVFIGRCPMAITDFHIKEHYKSLGADAIKDIGWGQGRAEHGSHFKGWGIITFRTTALAMRAGAMKPPVVNGQELVVQWKGYKPLDSKRPSQLLWEMKKRRESKGTEEGDDKGSKKWQEEWKRGQMLPQVEWNNTTLAKQPFQKDFYNACVKPQARTKEEIERWVDKNAVAVPEDSPPPILDFDEVDFGEEVNKVLRKKYKSPFPIQSVAWPVVLKGRDCIGIAQTGSGKTLAYALPAIVHLNAQVRPTAEEGPIVLVLAPTRELIIQICEELGKYQLAGGLRIALAYGGQDGGADRTSQANTIMRGVDIIGGTPGRLCDFVEARILSLQRVSFLVIDEADALLEMGFVDQTAALVLQTRPDRQTVMFTATWVKDVHAMADNMLTNPVKLTIGSNKEKAAEANRDVDQRVVIVDCLKDKFELLTTTIQQLKQRSPALNRTLVFVGMKKMLAPVSKHLIPRWSNSVYTICGDLHQTVRENIVRRFREDPRGILVATDLVARGMDIKDVMCVINFQLPRDIDQYVHRIGRTGRAGEKGVAVSFLCRYSPSDCNLALDIINCMKRVGQEPPAELYRLGDSEYNQQRKGDKSGSNKSTKDDKTSMWEDAEDDRWGPEAPNERVGTEELRGNASTTKGNATPVASGWRRPTAKPKPMANPFLKVRRVSSLA